MLKCPNNIICNNNISSDIELCLDCNMLFGTWRGNRGILDQKNTTCPICTKDSLCVTRPNCNHFICIDCFKTLYFTVNTKIIKPEEDINISEYLDYQNSHKRCLECYFFSEKLENNNE